jgi:hypothetical protein
MKFVQQRAVAFTLILVAQQAQALTAFGELGRYGDESNGKSHTGINLLQEKFWTRFSVN